MAETLEAWLTRQLRTVEEDGKCTCQLLLQAGDGGQVWDRWDMPLRQEEGGPGAYALSTLISEVIDGAAEEWPASRMHQVMVTALDRSGGDRGRWVKSVKGKSKTASHTMLASESVQHAAAMQAQVETTKVLLAACNNQIMMQQATIDALLRNVGVLTALICENKVEQALTQQGEQGEIQKELWGMAKEVGPEIVRAVITNMATKGKG